MRKLFVATAAVAIFALLVTPAMAKGPKGGGGSAVVVPSSIKLESYSDLHVGGYVGFEVNAVGLASWEWPMVAVWCYQDANGDGVHEWPNDAGDLVYMLMDYPDVEFLLGGGSSDWLGKGGAADCNAMLYAYGNKGNNQTIRQLATSAWFHAEG